MSASGVIRLAAASAATVGACLGLAGCAGATAAAGPAAGRVVVHVVAARHAERYEVQIHRQRGQLVSTQPIESGQTRVIAAPPGWIAIRIPGLCVLATPHTSEVVVRVTKDDCTLE